jgi:hypothetical protein
MKGHFTAIPTARNPLHLRNAAAIIHVSPHVQFLSMTKIVDAFLRLFGAMNNQIGNLSPAGFRKKKHFLLVADKCTFHQLQHFLRWLAKY